MEDEKWSGTGTETGTDAEHEDDRACAPSAQEEFSALFPTAALLLSNHQITTV